MQMTEIEIVGKFKRADNKREQIKILAELNACDEETIKQILRQNGVTREEYEPESKETKKRTRKSAKPKEEKKVEIEESKDIPENREILKNMVEEPDLTDEEDKQVERALAIPQSVRIACREKLDLLTKRVIAIEKERDEISDFLSGKI